MNRYLLAGLTSDLLRGHTTVVLASEHYCGLLSGALATHLEEAAGARQGDVHYIATNSQQEVRVPGTDGQVLFRSPTTSLRGLVPEVLVVHSSVRRLPAVWAGLRPTISELAARGSEVIQL